jgi:RNA polymerase sigma factor (sigma-70 family)
MTPGRLGTAFQHLRRRLGSSPADPLSDGQLLERFVTTRDESAFAELVRRHGPMVLAVCRRVLRDGHDADDAFQATFLVLVKKAGSIGKRDAVGGWLHRVAFHLALRARDGVQRRRGQERQVEDVNTIAADAGEPNDLRPILDEEVNRLPEKYRVPMVLCYFEGKTNEEAAQALHWPTGTVQGRLARAREMLRQRLERRGLALASATLTALLSESAAPAAVPAVLMSSTLQAAAQLAAGTATPLPAVALAEGMVHAMFMHKIKIAAAVLLAVGVAGMGASLFMFSKNPAQAKPDAPESLALRFAKYYEPVQAKKTASIPAYPLPLDVSKVANFDDAAQKLGLAADEASLKANGFAVLPGQGEDIVAPYRDLKKREVPIFITADTLLHLYHVQFDETLKDIEEREFYPDITALTQALLTQLAAQPLPADTADFREAQQKALTYLSIALKCLKPDAAPPKQVDLKDVDLVLEKMRKHEGFWPSQPSDWPLFRYAEDFSQYVPRGHYTRSEELKRYFSGMMWLGRMTFLLKGKHSAGPADTNGIVEAGEANQQTLAATLLTKLLAQAELPDQRKPRDVWERIYVVTSFYVGLADDLGVEQYHAALKKVCGAALNLAELNDPKKQLALRGELAKYGPPKIYSGTGDLASFDPAAGPVELVKALNVTTGFRFMGQRFVPDSYMLGKLVYPTVGEPTRDGMFTYVVGRGGPIRGSKRARAITHELGDDAYKHGRGPQGAGDALSYDEALTALQKEYGALSDKDWNRNLYWSWLHALKPLLAEYGTGYQTFQTTEAYRTKSLNTALASWAQLRHDTILYAKQSYTMRAGSARPQLPKPVQGYVEPLPEFYARLLTLARMSNQGLTQLKVLDERAKQRLGDFEKLLERLLAISEKELANEELKEADYDFIRNFGEQLERVVVTSNPQRLKALQEERRKAFQAGNIDRLNAIQEQINLESSPTMKTTVIADVHTEGNTNQVLEEGTGYVDLGVFVYQQPDGRLVLGAGPVLSYHEFKQPMKDRLTDEGWRELLKKGNVKQAEWTKAYQSGKGKYVCAE